MRRFSRKQINRSRMVTVTCLVIVIFLAGATTLAYMQKWWPFNQPTNYIIEGINYGPPTEEEIENSQNAKKKILENDNSEKNDSSNTESDNKKKANLRSVSIGVSHANVINDNVEIRAFTSNVIEGTGICTATLTHPLSPTVSQSAKAFVDASTSQCNPIVIPLNKFQQTGEWTLTVSYESPTSHGESEKIPVIIK